MKILIAATLIALLAGCAGMGTRDSSSGASGSSPSDGSYYQRDDIFHSWVN